MTAGFRFTCSICGKSHEGLPDFAFDAPIYYHQVPEADRGWRCYKTSDLCVIDERDYFVRGIIYVPILDFASAFGWGVWSSLSKPNYARYVELWDGAEPADDGPWFGWLSNRIPVYPETLSLKLSVRPQQDNLRPEFDVEPCEHPLSAAQREGMTQAEAIAIVERLMHPPGAASGSA